MELKANFSPEEITQLRFAGMTGKFSFPFTRQGTELTFTVQPHEVGDFIKIIEAFVGMDACHIFGFTPVPLSYSPSEIRAYIKE